MSYIKKNMKFLKEKQKNLAFFETYIDISKLRVLQLLTEEQKALETVKLVKYSNTKLLELINSNFFKNEKTFIETSDETRKTKHEVFFLVDSKDDDEFSEVMYKKLEETLEARIRKGDSVITFGRRVNMIAQKLELNIIQHFEYKVYENQNDFINKVATIIEVGFKNGIFSDATLIITQQNRDNHELIMKKLAPFEYEKIDDIYSDIHAEEFRKTSTSDFDKISQNSRVDYSRFFNELNFKKLFWIPNISFFKFKLVKAIIKQNIVEMRMLETIHRLKLEIQLLDEKRNKINEELVVVKRLVNRIRREKETESTIILNSAFKVRNAGVDILEEYRKKKDEDDLLISNKSRKVSQKGGVR